MDKLKLPDFYHKDGIVYEETYGNKSTTERLIQVLSQNKIYPKILFDHPNYELVYDEKRNKYVAAPTIEQVFHKLFIVVFS